MKNFKSHFVFNRGQRNGIFLLVIIIIGVQIAYFFINFSSEETTDPVVKQKILVFQQKIDSLKNIAAEDEFVIYPFNPNFITDYKGYTLGMSLEEIDRLQEYRKQDKWINSAEDFQKVTRVSDSLLQKIAIYFKFPDWVKKSEEKKEAGLFVVTAPKKDINTATAQSLAEINGLGKILSTRIIRYRSSIGGFADEVQLKDVYGLKPEVIKRITDKFEVKDYSIVEKQNINTITIAELSEIPYFNYELARKVVGFRKLRGKITSFEELAKIEDFPFHKIDRITLYLSIDQ